MALLRRILILRMDLNRLQPATTIMTHLMSTGSSSSDNPSAHKSIADWRPGKKRRSGPQTQPGAPPPSYTPSSSKQKKKPSIASLMKAAKEGHIQEAERALKHLKEISELELGPGLCVMMLNMYITAEQLPGALDALEQLHSLHPQATLQPSKVVALAVLLVHHGRIQECLSLLATEAERSAQHELANASAEEPSNQRQQAQGGQEEKATPEPASGAQQQELKFNPYMTKLCSDLLTAAGAGGDTATCHQLLELLLHHRYVSASRMLLGPLVRSYISKDDLEGALSTVETLVARYGVVAGKAELTHAFIKRKDSKSLQRLVDLSTAVMGLENSSLDLAVCFLEAGDIDKAVELLQSTGTVPSAERLQYLCQYYVKRGELSSLQGLLSLSRQCGASSSDTRPIYGHLLQAYERLRRHEDVTSVLAAMEQDGLTRQQCLPLAAAGASVPSRRDREAEPGRRPPHRRAAAATSDPKR